MRRRPRTTNAGPGEPGRHFRPPNGTSVGRVVHQSCKNDCVDRMGVPTVRGRVIRTLCLPTVLPIRQRHAEVVGRRGRVDAGGVRQARGLVTSKLQPDEEAAASERVTRSWLLASLVIGELLALAVIAGGLSPSKGVGGLVAMSMLLAAFLIALPVIGRELQEGRSRRERLATALRGWR